MVNNSGYSIRIEEGKMKLLKGILILLKVAKKCGLLLESHTSMNLTDTVCNSNDTTML